MKLKIFTYALASMITAASFISCSQNKSGESMSEHESESNDSLKIKNIVLETILTRRSVRDYLPQPVGRDTMEVITTCGINAPNGMNKQPWEIRVVDNKAFIDSMTKAFVAEHPDIANDPKFRNMFRNAPTVVFIAAENNSQLDCGLLGENMILAAWSMGIGSCCLGGPMGFMKSDTGKEYLNRLNFPEGYELVYAIGFGYPAETPEAKPRDTSKIRFID